MLYAEEKYQFNESYEINRKVGKALEFKNLNNDLIMLQTNKNWLDIENMKIATIQLKMKCGDYKGKKDVIKMKYYKITKIKNGYKARIEGKNIHIIINPHNNTWFLTK